MRLISVFCLAIAFASPPNWQTFSNSDNAKGQAQYRADTSTVKYLGDKSNSNDCQQSCLQYKNGSLQCLSWTYYASNCGCQLAGGCYAHVDAFWHPSSASNVFSGRDVANNYDPLHPAFHPGPVYNWMNDPNGPMYFNGYYHLFFQYNPYGAEWGSMSWGHSTSTDLVHWTHQQVAMFPDMNYDKDGVFSGSAVVANGQPTLIYTCVNDAGQQQCIATPKNASDPFLLEWVKSDLNPIIKDAPPGGNLGDFRDDTTPWQSNGQWYMAIGTNINGNGAAFLYNSSGPPFTKWSPLHPLWTSSAFGSMWECPDFFPIAEVGGKMNNWYTTKFSAQGRDWYAVGSYDQTNQLFKPQSKTYLYDGGEFYASKTFYDSKKSRQILYGWVAEDGGPADNNGWQGVQSFPRLLQYDTNLEQLVFSPVEEISLLHTGTPEVLSGVQINSGSFVPLNPGNQLQVVASFSISNSANQKFGFRVFSSKDGSQYTDVGVTYGNLHGPVNNTDLPGDEYRQFYYDSSTPTEDERVALCQQTCQNEASSMNCVSWTYVRQGYAVGGPLDPSPRCSLKNGIPGPNPSQCCISGTLTTNPVVISFVERSKSGSGNSGTMQNSVAMTSSSVLDLQLLLDHSIIELFVGGGRSVLTGRAYPTNTDNYISVFNTGDTALTVNLTRYELTSSDTSS